jgi:hypothetical protein
MRIVLIIVLAVCAAMLPTPFDVACIVVMALWHLWDMWTRQNALRRVAQGVQDKLNQELDELISEARSAPASTD